MTKSPAVFLMVAALAGILPAGAAPLKLSELAGSNLAEKTVSIPDFLAQKRNRKRASLSPGVELLVKFQSLERVRMLEVAPADGAAALALLKRRSDVEFAEKNRKLKRQFVPSDPLLGDQWQHDKIQSRKAWDLGTGSHAVTVAIVDYPFNLAHPDLAANTVAGWDVVNEVPVYSGNDWHSSMSAGMAAGVLDNGVGIAGAGNCRVMPINVDGYVATMDLAIRWAADHGARVVNLSWEGADSPVLNAAAEYLREETDGIVVMAGVNEPGFLDYPNQPYIIAVSMTDLADALRSSHGEHIDFSAPGYNVKSTSALAYDTGSGTSFSAPLASGILAALFSIDPTLTATQALSVLRQTAVDLGDPGWDQKFGWGRIDFYQAAWLAAAHSESPPAWASWIEPDGGTGITVSAEFHLGLSCSLFGKDSLGGTNWVLVDAVAQTNGQVLEYSVGVESTGQAFYKVAGELNL